MNSMTGYGQASWSGPSVAVDVAIRSVNNRFLKVVTHLPEDLDTLGPEIEEMLRRHLDRGTVHVDVHVRETTGRSAVVLNEARLGEYMKQLRGALKRVGVKEEPSLQTLLSLPGVLDTPGEDADTKELGPRVLKLIDQAARQLCAMRKREGDRTRKEMERLLANLDRCVQEVRKLAPQVPVEHQKRMLTRINELLAAGGGPAVTVNDLSRELAVWADRCDISEEMQRLESHLEEFRALLRKTGEAGKKLDFLTQELLREANTIGSKANDARISNHVIDMKCDIEKLKEQVQNVE